MYRELPITEARQVLTSLPELFAKQQGTVAVTRRGTPVLAVMSWQLYESILETMEILGDAEMMTAIRRSMEDVKAGRAHDWEDVKRELKL